MKTLKDGSAAFYASKEKFIIVIAVMVIVPAIFIGPAVFIGDMNPYTLLFFCVPPLLVFMFMLLINKTPYVKLTHSAVEAKGIMPILWNDILSTYIERRRYGKSSRHDFMCFEVPDLPRYKLTAWQKLNKDIGQMPYTVDLDLMTKKERGLFEQAIRARVKIDTEKTAQTQEQERKQSLSHTVASLASSAER